MFDDGVTVLYAGPAGVGPGWGKPFVEGTFFVIRKRDGRVGAILKCDPRKYPSYGEDGNVPVLLGPGPYEVSKGRIRLLQITEAVMFLKFKNKPDADVVAALLLNR